MIQKTWFALAALAITLHGAPVSTQTQQYTITDLGSLYGCCTSDDESAAVGINNAGDVVGWSLTQLGEYHPVPFIYRNGQMTAITTTEGYATAINNAGQVTGYIKRIGNLNMEAFLYDGAVHRLGGLPRHSPDGYSVGWALNNAGVVVGESGGMINPAASGFMVYVNGLMFSSHYRDARIAYGVNDSGAIVGVRQTDTFTRGFLLDRHGFQDLGTLIDNPVAITVPLAINASGVVVGYADGATSQRAFAYSNGVMRDLGVTAGAPDFPAGWEYSLAFAINTAGDIVGESSGGAFLYHDGVMLNLNDMIAHGEDGWPRFHAATGINDRGQIVGQAYFGDRPGLHACLLTPVPPPQ